MLGLEPSLEVYGTYGRPAALADWVELAACAGEPISESALSDLIDDNGWTTKPSRHFHATLEDYSLEADPDELARASFTMLRQRLSILGHRYPFTFERQALRHAGGSYNPYLSLLAITVAHAWPGVEVRGEGSPENVLEHVVAEVLRDKGLRVATMGALDRGRRTFPENLKAGAALVGLRAMPKPYPVAISAKDAGVDTLAGVTWTDGRPGQWVMLGQVTCAQTDHWVEKLDQPKPAIWADYLIEPHHPLAFLAVPHHVDAGHLAFLLKSGRGIVLDRLRLANHESGVSAEERHLIDLVLAAGVASGRAAKVKVKVA